MTTQPHILENCNLPDIPSSNPFQSSTYLAEVLHGFPQLFQADAMAVPSNKPPFQIPITIHKQLSI
jgi:hypothetical protein